MSLTPDRIQLHYAIQFIALIGNALGEPQPDESQGTLYWDTDLQSFVGLKIPHTQIQVALEPVGLTSLILEHHRPIAQFSLPDYTFSEAFQWHRQQLISLGLPQAKELYLPPYPPADFPDHPLAQGAPFTSGNPAARQELAAHYALTSPYLQAIAQTEPGAAPVHIWPHHFDLATLITLPTSPTAPDTPTQSIGVGFSPGDTSYDEPYWYVTPYPYPDAPALPTLSLGHWHTLGWVGAVLLATALKTIPTFPPHLPAIAPAPAPDLSIPRFLESAIQACYTLLSP